MRQKNRYRVWIAAVLTAIFMASLYLLSPLPAKALEVSFPTLPSGNTGNTHSFTVRVDIASAELVPIQSIDLKIYRLDSPASYRVTCTGLPLIVGSVKRYTNIDTGGGGRVSVTATSPDGSWVQSSGSGRVDWEGSQYDFGTTSGYGYQTRAASMVYAVSWTSPSSWPAGTYAAEVSINAASETLTETFLATSTSVTLSAAEIVSPGPAIIEPGVVDITDIVGDEGELGQDVTIESGDSVVKLGIGEGTTCLTREGEPFFEISITSMAEPPAPPADASVIGLIYDMRPDGATFNPSITITFTYDPAEIPAGIDEEDLVIAMWDEGAGEWVELGGCIVDPVNHTITASVSHFTPFAVVSRALPPEEEEVIPEEEEEAAPRPVIQWWLIGSIIAAVVVIGGVLVYFFWWRRRLA